VQEEKLGVAGRKTLVKQSRVVLDILEKVGFQKKS